MSKPIHRFREYWLATREGANQVVLHDGPHDSKEAVAKAKVLYDRIFNEHDDFVMVTISPVRPYGLELDDEEKENADLCAEMVDRSRVRRGIPAPEYELTPEQEETLAYLHGYPGEDAFGSK